MNARGGQVPGKERTQSVPSGIFQSKGEESRPSGSLVKWFKGPKLALALLAGLISRSLCLSGPKLPALQVCVPFLEVSLKKLLSIKRLPNNTCQILKTLTGNFYTLKREYCSNGRILVTLKCLWVMEVLGCWKPLMMPHACKSVCLTSPCLGTQGHNTE